MTLQMDCLACGDTGYMEDDNHNDVLCTVCKRLIREPAMTTQAENELICERLLGLTKHCSEPECLDWRTADGKRWYGTPAFTDWRSAGLALEALQKAGVDPEVAHYSGGWHCVTQRTEHDIPPKFENGPDAVRAAALDYLGARK